MVQGRGWARDAGGSEGIREVKVQRLKPRQASGRTSGRLAGRGDGEREGWVSPGGSPSDRRGVGRLMLRFLEGRAGRAGNGAGSRRTATRSPHRPGDRGNPWNPFMQKRKLSHTRGGLPRLTELEGDTWQKRVCA